MSHSLVCQRKSHSDTNIILIFSGIIFNLLSNAIRGVGERCQGGREEESRMNIYIYSSGRTQEKVEDNDKIRTDSDYYNVEKVLFTSLLDEFSSSVIFGK